jgi:aminomethyltransferase
MPIETPLREQHEKAGAQFAVYFGCLLPERFIDSAAEYRLAREAVALIDTGYHAFIYLDGLDRVRYLNAVLTNNIRGLAAGQGNVSLLLNPQGHILAEIETYALAERLLTASHALVHERTLATLDKFIIMDDVTLDDATERVGSMALEGAEAAAVLQGLCGVELEAMADGAHVEVTVDSIPCRVVRRSQFGQTGAELIADRSQLAALWQTLLDAVRVRRGGPVGYAALNALRLEAGVPWFSYDFDDNTIPHEAALESSHISYVKGCYTGQEIVERVRSRGHVNRRRVGLQFSGSAAPEHDAKLLADGKEAGQVTSAAFSPATGCAIGMSYVRREHNSLGSQLQWAGGTAEVIELPLAGVKTATGKPAP